MHVDERNSPNSPGAVIPVHLDCSDASTLKRLGPSTDGWHHLRLVCLAMFAPVRPQSIGPSPYTDTFLSQCDARVTAFKTRRASFWRAVAAQLEKGTLQSLPGKETLQCPDVCPQSPPRRPWAGITKCAVSYPHTSGVWHRANRPHLPIERYCHRATSRYRC